MLTHECPGSLPVCPECGRRWDYYTAWSDGSVTYTSQAVVAKYRALFGEPQVPFQRVEC